MGMLLRRHQIAREDAERARKAAVRELELAEEREALAATPAPDEGDGKPPEDDGKLQGSAAKDDIGAQQSLGGESSKQDNFDRNNKHQKRR